MKFLLKTKSREQILRGAEDGPHPLKRILTATHLVLLGIGCVIGAGILVLSGVAAATYAGPAITLSFALSGLACAFAGLCYAEFASSLPVSGSAYTYAYATLGELFAWVIGWDLILEYLFGASSVAVGWSGYVVSFFQDFGVRIPAFLAYDPHLNQFTLTGAWLNLPAMLVIALLTALLVIGIRGSANFNNAIVMIKVTVILLFIVFGLHYIDVRNWQPFLPPNTGHWGEFGGTGVLRGAAVVFFAYIGFDAVSTAAQEARNPQRDMPIGILLSLAVCAVLYIAVALVLTGLVPYPQLNVPDPIAAGINATGPGLHWLRPVIKLGAIAGLSSVILVLLLGQPRIFHSMARDGLLPARFAVVHPRFKTPYFTTLITGTVAAVIAGLFLIAFLGEMVSIGALLAITLVCIGVLVMRRIRPDEPRPFRTPWVPVVPLLGAGLSLLQMVFLPLGTWVRLLVWMALGFAIYFTYSRRHSKLRLAARQEPV